MARYQFTCRNKHGQLFYPQITARNATAARSRLDKLYSLPPSRILRCDLLDKPTFTDEENHAIETELINTD
jgi:hypothetical protein